MSKMRMMRIFALALLTVFSMGVGATVKVEIGTFTGGTVTAKQEAEKDGKVTVTLTVTPASGYTITKKDITVVATFAPSSSRSNARGKAPEISSTLDLIGDDPKDLSQSRKYTVNVDANLGVWVKEAKFQEKRDDTKAGTDDTPVGNDYSGTYYIGSTGYVAANTTTNFYLCPTESWYNYQSTSPYYLAYSSETDNGQPFMTTYKCRNNSYDARKAVWIIEKKSGTEYYYIKHAIDGKYLTFNVAMGNNSNVGRMRVHLEAAPSDDDDALFRITNNSDYYNIQTKKSGAADGRNFLNVTDGNKGSLAGSGKNDGPSKINVGGIIGLWTSGTENTSKWYLEKATIDPPTITNNETVTNTFTITAATGATIYYTTDGSTPTASHYTGTGTTSVNVDQTGSMTVIKAIAKATSDNFPTIVTTYNIPACERPAIKVSGGTVTITCATAGATIHYSIDGNPATSSSTLYTGPFAKGSAAEIRAVATKAGYVISSEAVFLPPTEVSSSSEMTDMNGNYLLTSSFTSSGSIGTSANPFKGTIDGDWNQLTLSYPLVAYADGAIIKNIMLDNDNVTIGGNENGNAGAICCEATGDTRIYNCGVLGGSVGGSNNVGGIVGLLDGRSRVINCYNYAKITSGSNCGGIVGYNNVASTSSNLQTMVMNCMFYGNITGGNAAPIYGGEIIHNKYASADDTGLNNYCYFLYDEEKNPYVKTIASDKYHGALGAEERYLNRFEFFRMTLNSTRNLAAYYATGDATKKEEMAKWVLDKSIAPYPILKVQDTYPSIVNPDADHATTQTDRNKGGLLGTLSVTIQMGDGGPVFSAPTGASITTGSLTLNVTDKDYDNFNFNYKKVQLPYYNEVGTGNYMGGRVVTGWKITSITGGTSGSFTTNTYDYPSFNFVDRKCTNKDLYNESNRVFAQGAYWEVPDGVESITIEPYWAKAVYLSDANYDVTYTVTMNGNTATAHKYGVSVCGDCPTTYNEQTVYTDLSTAMTNLGSDANHKVYDYAVVLLGNYHQAANDVLVKDGKPVTFMSADLDGDNEPDNTLFYYHNQRRSVSPIRFDFLNIPGIGMVKRTYDATMDPEPGIFAPQGWFEITNTVFIRFGQFEYAGSNSFLKTTMAPLILQGGIYEQFVSCCRTDAQNTNYLLIGGNAWFKNFANGCHTAQANTTPKVPINVTGGDYTNFYLTGIYQPAAAEASENAECYIDGGRFTEVAGAGMQRIDGNVTWLINAADITHFYGGGINDAQPIKGNISTTISNSHVDEFYGGPKFGDMVDGKTVTTTATDCYFGLFFGAGYGGTSLNRVGCEDKSIKAGTEPSWSTYLNDHYKRKYETVHKTNSGNVTVKAISTSYDYEYIMHSDGSQTVARFFVNFASLSLASTRNVTTDLSGCTIGTFYGGGRLGSVNGDVTSTLTGCTVTGNVYGAGFSAEVPTVEVWPIEGLSPEPKYNQRANVFNNASVKTPEPVLYKWDTGHGLSTSNPFYDNGDDHFIYTGNLEGLGEVKGNATLILNSGTTVDGNVFGGGDEGSVGGSVVVNIEGGTVHQSVYGGGALANTNTANAAATPKTTTVNLKGGTINNNVYGGGLGRLAVEGKEEVQAVGTEGEPGYIPGSPAVAAVDAIEALVYGDVLVTLNGTKKVVNGTTTYPDNCVVKGSIFGCNNQNGSPQRAVTVHVHKTVGYEGHMGTPQDKLKSRDKNDHSYHLKAVYGGGDLAAYYPQEKLVRDTAKTHVIIDGCGQTSIYQVYGGGNAASTPATNVTVNGTYEIEEVFGGGNGHDAITVNGETISNPGANVGFKAYSDEAFPTRESRSTQAFEDDYTYGTGRAQVDIYGGTIHAVFGGSNTKGNVREIAVAMLDMDGGCEFDVDEAYGGGKSADMDGEARLEMKCIPKMTTVYGGAMNADVNNDVKLNITNGTFEQVFGGNNMGGRILGTITVNIEETGCKPIIIGELYGGGNRAPYSIYGYEDSGVTDLEFGKVVWLAKESKEEGGPEYGNPKVNVKSFTSIGNIYGGGYGQKAVMVGDPEVNVNVVMGSQTNHDEAAYAGVTKEIDGDIVTIPPHTKGQIGAIGNVFGGGNAAKVIGSPKVRIGTAESVDYVTNISGESTPRTDITPVGANIIGNVYGGGNAADVVGNPDVQIGK